MAVSAHSLTSQCAWQAADAEEESAAREQSAAEGGSATQAEQQALDAAKAANITAVIAMDQAVIAYAKQIGIEIHISTQINITNIETVKFYGLFADTMVMSRELSLRQVKKIVEQIEKEDVRGPSGNLVEVEIFGHGALCMAVSGKCYLSLHSHNSSANRGACKQNCRS